MPERSADTPPPASKQHVFQPPRGTRDFYPPEMLRRRWIESRWRAVSTRHGFDEIDGPRFEHADLYTVKSGDGILSELFSFTRAGGETRFALRPEFTPTLARMAAARAGSLPKPTKWFSVGPYFRAERPQRGRLREFLQWNADIIGDGSPAADAELIACCVEMLRSAGLTERDVTINIGHRDTVIRLLDKFGAHTEDTAAMLALIDKIPKLTIEQFRVEAGSTPIPMDQMMAVYGFLTSVRSAAGARPELLLEDLSFHGRDKDADKSADASAIMELRTQLARLDVWKWCRLDFSIVRGLAYYTGMVFEVHEATGAERAIAGGGRYDNLVSLFGGPPTPAVGFAMGDVVLANVLQDKGLMPSDEQLRDELGLRPDVFVISTGDDASEAALPGLVADLRRAGLHARHTHKSTRNIGKLIKEADAAGARTAFIIESPDAGTLKHLATGAQQTAVPVADLARRLREISDAATL